MSVSYFTTDLHPQHSSLQIEVKVPSTIFDEIITTQSRMSILSDLQLTDFFKSGRISLETYLTLVYLGCGKSTTMLLWKFGVSTIMSLMVFTVG